MPSAKSTSTAPWCYTFLHPFLVIYVDHLISRSSVKLGLLPHIQSYYHFSFRCLLKVYPCYIRPLFGMAAHLLLSLSVRSARQLEAVQQKALSICSVDSARISSLSGRQNSLLVRLFLVFDLLVFTWTFRTFLTSGPK